jgi:anti-sigma B factor antagonist
MSGADSEFVVRVESCAIPGVQIVSVDGELDGRTAPQLARALDRRPPASPATVVILDLCAVSFLCAAGLRVLAEAARDGAELLVVATGRAVRRPMELTGMSSQLSLHPSRERALAAAIELVGPGCRGSRAS